MNDYKTDEQDGRKLSRYTFVGCYWHLKGQRGPRHSKNEVYEILVNDPHISIF